MRAGLQLCKTEKEDARVHCAVLNQQPGTRPHPHRQTPPPGEWYDRRSTLQDNAPTHGTTEAIQGRPAPSGPNSVPTTTTPPRPRSPPPPQGTAVLGAGGQPAAELVSVPPSSTTPHAPRPTR